MWQLQAFLHYNASEAVGLYQFINIFTSITKLSINKVDFLLTNQKDNKYEPLLTPKTTYRSIFTVDFGRYNRNYC